MVTPRPPIFRENAIKQYMQGRDKDTLPRFISWPIALLLWTLIVLLVIAGLLAWGEKIPVFVKGSGIVLHEREDLRTTGLSSSHAFALIFLPPEQLRNLHVGLPVRIYIGGSGPEISSKIAGVEPGVTNPYLACREYGLGVNCTSLITQPAVVVLVKLDTISSSAYAGSVLTAEVEIGARRIISLLPI